MSINSQIADFEKVDLDAIGRGLILSNRKDLKYLLPIGLLSEILTELKADYVMMSVDGVCLQEYSTSYYDTVDFQFYRDHHQGKQNRMKVRSRTYPNGESFFEVKRKTNQGTTLKNRISCSIESQMKELYPDVLKELSLPEDLKLTQQLMVRYHRLTLFSKSYDEKVTIDLKLQYQQDQNGYALPLLCIAESKGKRQLHSRFNTLMRTHKIKQSSFSKYCYGMYHLVPAIKKNNFKRLEHKVEKLMHAHEVS